jgi:hypothetical protein
MIQSEEKQYSPRKGRKRELVADKSMSENPSHEKSEESFLICNDWT